MKQKKLMHIGLILTSLLCVCQLSMAAATQWQSLAPGIDYAKLPIPTLSSYGKLHAFRIDLRKAQLDLALAEDYHRKTASAAKFARKMDAQIAINGGFFSPEHQPLGLRIKQGKVRNRLKKTSWWGVFYLRNNQPKIVSQRHFHNHRSIDMAIQAGPRLIVNNQIPSLKTGFAERSAIGITRNQKVILVVTENAPMTTHELAKLMRSPQQKGGLGCTDALNLDGGKSTQLYADIGSFHLNVPNFSSVTDAITVKVD